MIKRCILLAILLSTKAVMASYAGLKTTVEGITIKNVHSIEEGRIFRGQAPEEKINELINLGITDVLIFKKASQVNSINPIHNEVTEEVEALIASGFNPQNITAIDFRWKQFPSFKEACEQTVQALRIMKSIKASNDRKLFFHCTVGEDRTGHLAGLWYLLTTDRQQLEVFRNEMCEHGYEAGDPKKPQHVVDAIRRDLTPIFLKMTKMIKSGELSLNNLDPSTCNKEPYTSPKGIETLKKIQKFYRCREEL